MCRCGLTSKKPMYSIGMEVTGALSARVEVGKRWAKRCNIRHPLAPRCRFAGSRIAFILLRVCVFGWVISVCVFVTDCLPNASEWSCRLAHWKSWMSSRMGGWPAVGDDARRVHHVMKHRRFEYVWLEISTRNEVSHWWRRMAGSDHDNDDDMMTISKIACARKHKAHVRVGP